MYWATRIHVHVPNRAWNNGQSWLSKFDHDALILGKECYFLTLRSRQTYLYIFVTHSNDKCGYFYELHVFFSQWNKNFQILNRSDSQNGSSFHSLAQKIILFVNIICVILGLCACMCIVWFVFPHFASFSLHSSKSFFSPHRIELKYIFTQHNTDAHKPYNAISNSSNSKTSLVHKHILGDREKMTQSHLIRMIYCVAVSEIGQVRIKYKKEQKNKKNQTKKFGTEWRWVQAREWTRETKNRVENTSSRVDDESCIR